MLPLKMENILWFFLQKRKYTCVQETFNYHADNETLLKCPFFAGLAIIQFESRLNCREDKDVYGVV